MLSGLESMFLYRFKIPISPPDWTILDNWVFENFILADEPLAKALRNFETFCIS